MNYSLVVEYVYEPFPISRGYYGIRLNGEVIAGAMTMLDANILAMQIEDQLVADSN